MILNLSVKMPSSPPGSGTKHPAVLKNTRGCGFLVSDAQGRVPSLRRRHAGSRPLAVPSSPPSLSPLSSPSPPPPSPAVAVVRRAAVAAVAGIAVVVVEGTTPGKFGALKAT